MLVDEKIYPVEREETDFDFTKKVGDFALNEKLDESIVYSSSNSAWADLKHNVIYSWYYTNVGKYKIIADNMTANYQRKILAMQNAGGIFSYANNNDSFGQLQHFKFGYDAETINDYYNYNQLIRGFKYFSLCACIYIEHYTKAGYNSTLVNDMKTYFETYSTNKIKRVILTLYSGSNSYRSSTSIQFINYIDYSLPFFTIPNVRDETNYTINYETIINYFPFYTSSTNNTIGTTVLGMAQASGSYQTSAVLNEIKGNNFFRANTNGVNWDNVNDISYSQIKVATFQPAIEIDRNSILHMCATYGVMFTDDETVAKTLDLTVESNLSNEHLYFPVIENNKLWQGNYTSGSENLNNPVKEWNSDKNAPFVSGSPSIDNDDEKFGDDELTSHGGSTSALTHRYVIDNATMQAISNYINNVDDNLFTAIVNNMKMAGESPINSVVSVMYCPINISTFAPTTENIIIGTNFINVGTSEKPTALAGNKLVTDSVIFNLGECTINAKNKNYLDYEPYTKYVCYIPFCNFVELESSIIMNKKIGFQLICDLVAGSCEGIIRIGGLNGRIYKSVGGTFATQCSVQGLDSANYVNGIVSSMGKYIGGIGTMIGATVGVATGGVSTVIAGAGLLAGAGTTASAIYDFNTNSKNFTATGKSIGLIGQRMPLHVCIYKFECKDNSDTNYGKFVGYACEFSETLNNLSGFTVCANAYVECNATNTEKEKIKTLLETGVYI